MNSIKPLAFYLPQFHRVKENDEWWGQGFTEWTNVAKGKPNFPGHYQPHVPADMGFYDLHNVENMREQADLARQYGLYGFCFYYYRFKDGRRILETPLNNYVKSDIDFPFCYCWANENWTKTWDGLDKEVLLEQNHGGHDDRDFLKELIDVFQDPRYIKVDGKPMLLVYRADLLKNSLELTQQWRELARAAGFPDLHLCAVQFYGIDDPAVYGFDAAVEFPPHKYIGSENCPDVPVQITNPEFRGGIVDYRKIVRQALNRASTAYKCYRGIIPSWDNTARRQDSGHIIINSSPTLYQFWMKYLVKFSKKHLPKDEQFIFINAWNEWAEGAHLEPDLRYGRAYLEATLCALNEKKLDLSKYISNENILSFLMDELSPEVKFRLEKAFEIALLNVKEQPLTFDAPIILDVQEHQSNEENVPVVVHSLRVRDMIKIKYPRLASILIPVYAKLRKML